MCDTFVALPDHTTSGHLLFGKNSDREPNEAQAILRVPARTHREPTLRCTYIEIPQVKETYEVLLSKPFQMWGAEMGVNEHGLVIGNEAVFTKVKFRKKNDGLTGMDLLRLALERTKSAPAALDCITGLLAQYGQDACGGYRNRNFFYHNSFLIADPEGAWVLETAGRHWAAQQVRGFRSISNGLTIGAVYDRISEGTEDFARKQGWIKRREDFHFAHAFSDWFYTRMSRCRDRQYVSNRTGEERRGQFTVKDAFAMLRTHHPPGDAFRPHRATAASLCMHATGLTNPSQTTGSLVAVIRRERPATVWLTGTSLPCLSVFKPFFLGGKVLSGLDESLPGAQPDQSLWWRAEQLHRLLCRNYKEGRALILPEARAMEDDFLRAVRGLITSGADAAALDSFSREALHRYDQRLREWRSAAKSLNLERQSGNLRYRCFVDRRDAQAGL